MNKFPDQIQMTFTWQPGRCSRWQLARCIPVAAMLIAGLVGCTGIKSHPDFDSRLANETAVDDAPAEVDASQKVRWDGGGVIIGERDSLAFDAGSFLATAQGLIQENRIASLQGMVKGYPDIALQSLQESPVTAGNVATLRAIASILDSTWSNNGGWQGFVNDIQQLPRASSAELDVRMRFWRYLKNNQPGQALKLKITRTLGNETGPVIRAECHRLQAIAAMMQDDPQTATRNLETAIDLVHESCPWYACKLRLLLGEFYRHAGRWDDWKSTWQQAVTENSQLAKSRTSLDPQFWNRAAFLRPAGHQWPAEVIKNLKQLLRDLDVAETENTLRLTADEAVIWFAIGMQHLRRAEGQNALLAFKKSEASESNQHSNKALQLYQSRALVVTGQPGAASAILYRMVAQYEGTTLADRAKAILASMKLQNGSLDQGLNLVTSAIESIESWPRDEQTRTRADYGLALLMKGHESRGLQQLDQAFQEFLSAGETEQARQCLWNRATYFEKTDQKAEYRVATQQLTDLESRIH